MDNCSGEVALSVNGVSMEFRLVNEKIDSLKDYLIKRVKNKIAFKKFNALTDVSFQVSKGEVFGIIGYNGAGKSTLLKVMSGILKPTSGQVQRKGTIAPLIELGAGFDPQLSGKENIVLNGLLLGLAKRKIEEKIDDIIAFSELEEFIHTPLKNYSSGMKARLGFSIATSIQPDLLVVDEVLSVGDIKFKKKCEDRIRAMVETGTTVLFVSHSINQIKELCDRVLWLEKGKVREIGASADVCSRFVAASQ